MRIVAIIQARLGSTRLPGKVMIDLAGEPLLARVVERASRASSIDGLVVATTVQTEDAVIAELCRIRGWSFFRGSSEDVLDRYYQAAVQHRADAVVRITSDNPLIDPDLVDQVVREFAENQPELHYVSTSLGIKTFPLGLGVEVVRFDALAQAWKVATDQPSREHVTLFVYRHPELFALRGVYCDHDYSNQRWTVDTPEDLEVVRLIYRHFGNDGFTWRQILALMEEHPEWREINRHVAQTQP